MAELTLRERVEKLDAETASLREDVDEIVSLLSQSLQTEGRNHWVLSRALEKIISRRRKPRSG